MKTFRNAMFGLAVLSVLASDLAAFAADTPDSKQARPAKERPKIQLAILLDTSNSMDGLINQARTQLWKIVNELATAQRDGQVPEMQVALYEYGKPTLPKEKGYVRQIVPLTDDLDKVSEELFALATNGGDEYCGQVIAAATAELAWSKSDRDLKLIFIAGNEPFTQGPLDYKQACGEAIGKGITVNTIFCGREAQGISSGWLDGAKLADGSFLHIDQSQPVAQIRTPFDERLAELSSRVNRTYLFFGAGVVREEAAARQQAQDAAAQSAAPAAAAERALFKASGQYRGSAADLVDEYKSGKLKLEELKEEELPEELKKLKPEDRKALLDKKAEERDQVQSEIKKLSEQRKEYIAEQRKKGAESEKVSTFDTAMIQALREQASRKKFQFSEKD